MKPLVEVYLTEMETKIEEDMMTIVQSYGLNVDRARLKQAIVDAKAFYDEGYRDGEKAASKWIPVEERLPENGQEVLCWYEYFRFGDYNRMYRTYGVGYCFNGYWGGEASQGQRNKVLAWMPLPEPPKDFPDIEEDDHD